MIWQPVGIDLLDRVDEGLLSATFRECYRWAQNRITMPAEDNRPAAPYSADRYPWVKEILNSRARYNWVMKGAQVGLTVCGIVRAFYEVDYHKNDVLYLMPTDKVALNFSKTRLNPLIQLSEYLRNRVDSALDVKMIGLNSLHVRGAVGEINTKSTPVARLILDEFDELTDAQIRSALHRLSGKEDKIVWGMSTPKYPHQGVHKYYLQSTQEHFMFDCPHCGRETELTYPESIAIKGTSVDDPECADSYFKCYQCDGVLPHETKTEWLATARWKPTNTEADPDHRGFWLPQLYSPTRSAADIAVEYHAGIGDEDARREFHNSSIGVPYVEDGSQVNDQHIDACLKPYSRNAKPPQIGDAAIITLGVDPGAVHYWVAVKWELKPGAGEIIDRAHGRVIGLGRALADEWETEIHSLMRRYQVKSCVVDAQPDPTHPRKFARTFPGYVFLCYYVVGRAAREITISEDDYGAQTARVDKTTWVSKTLGRVMQGEIDFPADIPFEFRQHLKNQIRTFKRDVDGNYKAEYEKIGPDHFAHALCYAELALRILDPSTHTSDVITSFRG